jgi:hypothetical protein
MIKTPNLPVAAPSTCEISLRSRFPDTVRRSLREDPSAASSINDPYADGALNAGVKNLTRSRGIVNIDRGNGGLPARDAELIEAAYNVSRRIQAWNGGLLMLIHDQRSGFILTRV